MSVTISANVQPTAQPRRRGPGRPFEKGVSQTAKFALTRAQMEAEVVGDLERVRSRSHSDTNTALKVWAALAAKYTGERAPDLTAFDRYIAEKKGQQSCE